MLDQDILNVKRQYTSGIWKSKDFIQNEMSKVNMNEVNNSVTWALCTVQEKNNICADAMINVISDYGVSKSAFYRAKSKLKKGGIPGEGKCTILTPNQWKNVEEKIISDFQKDKKTKVSEISQLVFLFLFKFSLDATRI
jgi:hypothetical protein